MENFNPGASSFASVGFCDLLKSFQGNPPCVYYLIYNISSLLWSVM